MVCRLIGLWTLSNISTIKMPNGWNIVCTHRFIYSNGKKMLRIEIIWVFFCIPLCSLSPSWSIFSVDVVIVWCVCVCWARIDFCRISAKVFYVRWYVHHVRRVSAAQVVAMTATCARFIHRQITYIQWNTIQIADWNEARHRILTHTHVAAVQNEFQNMANKHKYSVRHSSPLFNCSMRAQQFHSLMKQIQTDKK